MSRWMMALAALALPSVASAACTVVRGAEVVYLPDGPAKAGDIRIEDGRIQSLGEVAVEGCTVIEAAGRTVTYGLTEVSTTLGLVEIDLEDATVDANGGGDPVRAALRVTDAYNPRSTLIPAQRVEGITSAVTAPGGGRIAGQGGWVDLAGATQREAVANPSVGLWASMGGESRAQGLLELRELLADARWLRRARGDFDRGNSRDLAASKLDLEALFPVLDGTKPLVLAADRASDIEAVLRFAEEEGVRVVIAGAAEGWLLADALAAAGVPVIVDPLVYGPGGFTQMHARSDNAAMLVAAGVDVVLSSFSTHNARTLKQVAGNAVRGGLGHDDAVRSITEVPARVFGMTSYGRIAPGQVANLVVWGGDPLEIGTPVEAVIIRGAPVELRSRQTELRDRYATLPGTPVPPVSLD